MEKKNNAKGGIYLCYNKSQAYKGTSCHDHDDHDVCEDDHLYYDHDGGGGGGGGGGMMMMMSWPPRSYTCSFCKREFRSAQALGGHMNVHRRDRAQLRQQISQQIMINPNPPLNLNLNLPPNPNYNTFALLPPRMLPHPPPPHLPRDVITRRQFECFRNNLVGLKKQGDYDNHVGLAKKRGIIRLDTKEDLDLELRLGYN